MVALCHKADFETKVAIGDEYAVAQHPGEGSGRVRAELVHLVTFIPPPSRAAGCALRGS